ncbi:hypothetical protein AAU57_08715 [Nonlabens sp. YIK11]|nr:hypothetical protein AAU57_08715 [Nonlabens sp. YIK11]
MAEEFFMQTQHSIVIDPEPEIEVRGKNINANLPPDTFFKLISSFELKYPYIIENEIYALKIQMRRDQIEPEQAIEICKRLKDMIWCGSTACIASVQQDHMVAEIQQGIKVSESEALKFFKDYITKVELTMESIFEMLCFSLDPNSNRNDSSGVDGEILPINFINNFDNVPPEEVFKFYEKELLNKGVISKLDLNKFLKSAFEDLDVPKEKIRLIRYRTKGDIGDVFYRFYKDIARGSQGEKQKYLNLLIQYFVDFTKDKGGQSHFRRKY